jgi:hypothetical protein
MESVTHVLTDVLNVLVPPLIVTHVPMLTEDQPQLVNVTTDSMMMVTTLPV